MVTRTEKAVFGAEDVQDLGDEDIGPCRGDCPCPRIQEMKTARSLRNGKACPHVVLGNDDTVVACLFLKGGCVFFISEF